MTVVDVRAPRRPSARPPKKVAALEPGLSRRTTLRTAVGIIALGAVAAMISGASDAPALKAAFVIAAVITSLLGRPSTLRTLLKALPISWLLGVIAVGLTISTEATTKEKVLDVGQDLVLWASWLWIGWVIALVGTFARGGLRRRARISPPASA